MKPLLQTDIVFEQQTTAPWIIILGWYGILIIVSVSGCRHQEHETISELLAEKQSKKKN